jgi:hypothetical protein
MEEWEVVDLRPTPAAMVDGNSKKERGGLDMEMGGRV